MNQRFIIGKRRDTICTKSTNFLLQKNIFFWGVEVNFSIRDMHGGFNFRAPATSSHPWSTYIYSKGTKEWIGNMSVWNPTQPTTKERKKGKNNLRILKRWFSVKHSPNMPLLSFLFPFPSLCGCLSVSSLSLYIYPLFLLSSWHNLHS